MSQKDPESGDIFMHNDLGWYMLLVGDRDRHEPLKRVFFTLNGRSFIQTKGQEWNEDQIKTRFQFVGNLNGMELEEALKKNMRGVKP